MTKVPQARGAPPPPVGTAGTRPGPVCGAGVRGDSKPGGAPAAAAPSPRPSRPRGARHARGASTGVASSGFAPGGGTVEDSGARPQESARSGSPRGPRERVGSGRRLLLDGVAQLGVSRSPRRFANTLKCGLCRGRAVWLPAGRKMSARPAGAAFLGPLKGTWLRLE